MKLEKQLMEKFKEILEKESEITDTNIFYNVLGNYVVTFNYDGQKYVVEIEEC